MSQLNNTKTFGALAEDLAASYYLKKGHTVLFRNFRTKFGEIDLVTQCEDTIYLVEVKATKSLNPNLNPFNKWNLIQKHRMMKVFTYYLLDKLPLNHNEITIHFIWFALDQENRLKLICFNNEIETDYG